MAEENAVIEKQSSEDEGTQKELTFEINEVKEEDSSEEVQSEIQPEDSLDDQDEDKELKEHGVRVQKRINTLTYRAKEGERVADEAMNYAKGVVAENDALKRRLSGQENVSISEAEQRNISQMAEAKTALKAAHEAADSDASAAASELIGKLASDGNAIHQAKRRMDAQKAVEEDTPAQASAPAQVPAQQNVPTQEPEVVEDPKAEAWAAKTKWFGEHEGMTHYAMTQHYSLVEKEGFDPHSDEYYNEIENRVQKTFPHMFESASESSASYGAHQAVNGTKSKQTVAPARNSSGSAKKNNKITVSTSEQTVARGLGISNEAYAREKARLQKERDAENA